MMRGGSEYFIKGVGGDHSIDDIQRLGGNSVRTWGIDNAGDILAEASSKKYYSVSGNLDSTSN